MRFLLIIFGALTAGCVSVNWERESRFTPPDEQSLDGLQAGESGLGHCLDALGAPLWVWEYDGDGVALAYGWLEERRWNINVSAPVSDSLSASFDFTDAASNMEGLVLLFDEELILHELRRGLLVDLTTAARRARPAPPAD